MDSLAKEILGIAFPSALAVAADPIASLIDTAFIGHLGTFFSLSIEYDTVRGNLGATGKVAIM